MNPAEIAKLLSLAAAYDRRTIGKTDIAAWHRALERFDYDDAAEAVVEHYEHHTEQVMPAHVSAYCRKRGNERADRHALPTAAGVSDHDAIARIRAQAPPYTVEDDDRTVLWQGPAKALAERVNADPDARAALAEPPLNYTNWSGYVPPRLYDGKHNDSPIRARLLTIVRYALTKQDSNHHTERDAS